MKKFGRWPCLLEFFAIDPGKAQRNGQLKPQSAGTDRHSAPFDRLIFIGHGGYDGPILKEEVIRQGNMLEGSSSTAVRMVELQPGLRHVLTFKYDIHRNPAFSAYVDSHWQSLLAMNDADIIRTLKLQEERTQPLDGACFTRHCPPRQLDATENPRARSIKIKACEFACRDPLFV